MVVPEKPAVLLREKDDDLQDMLGVAHPLHRRRVCLGIQKIKDKEEEEVRELNEAKKKEKVLLTGHVSPFFLPPRASVDGRSASHQLAGRRGNEIPPPFRARNRRQQKGGVISPAFVV